MKRITTHNEEIVKFLGSIKILSHNDESHPDYVTVECESICNHPLTKGLSEEDAYNLILGILEDEFNKIYIGWAGKTYDNKNLYLTTFLKL